jgi:glycosyltransferase involved in cell wall biosynthesis
MITGDYFREEGIIQFVCGISYTNIQKIFLKKFNLLEYHDNKLPTLFLIGNEDIQLLNSHIGDIFLMTSNDLSYFSKYNIKKNFSTEIIKDYFVNSVENIVPVKNVYMEMNHIQRNLIDNIDIFIVSIYPKEQYLNDGYIARINYIFKHIYEKISKKILFINISRYHNNNTIIKYNDDVYEYNITEKYNMNYLVNMFQNKIVLIETLHNCIYFEKYLNEMNFFVDMHGVVPEEEAMQGADNVKWEILEKKVIDNAKKIFVVTNAMRNHFIKKYNKCNRDKFIVIYILGTKEIEYNIDLKNKKGIIYSGGIQKWQNINIIVDNISSLVLKNDLTFLSNNQKIIEKTIKFSLGTHEYTKISPNIKYAECKYDMVNSYYINKKYGLILRDDDIVNNVSCPTKLTDYILNGIIPIVKTENIGDYVEFGYNYIKFSDFLLNNDKYDFDKMINKNFEILCKMYSNNCIELNYVNYLFNNYNTINIAIFVASLDKGGLENVIYNILKKLDRRIFNVYLFVENENGYVIDNVRNLLNDVKINVIRSENDMENAIIKNNINIVNYHFITKYINTMKRFNVKICYTIHNTYIWFDDETIKNKIEDYKLIDDYISVSSCVKDYFSNKFFIDKKKITVIPNGVDIEEMNNTVMDITMENNFVFEDNIFYYCNISSITPTKCQHSAILSLNIFLEKNINLKQNIKLLFVGNVYDINYKNFLLSLIKKHNLENNVIFMDFVSPNKLMYIYSKIHCIIQTSFIEGWSCSLTEALYYKKPIIITNVGSAKDIVYQSDIGIVVNNAFDDILLFDLKNLISLSYNIKMKNLCEIVSAMEIIYNNFDEWKEKSQYGYMKIITRYNISNMITSYEKKFLNLMNETKISNVEI